jgi:hypothetical protein
MSGCAPIVDNGFEFREDHPLYGCVKYFAGTFDTPSHATGNYGVSKCGSTLISIPSTGTFEASRQASTLDAPVLHAIDNADGDGSYTVSWSEVSAASAYTLEEDDNASFSSPSTAYTGPSTSAPLTGRDVGTYYYRVRASTSSTTSPWSNVQSVAVTESPVGPLPGHYTGTPSLSFDVTADGKVCAFDITVPFQSSTCHVQMPGCAPIVDNGFEFREEHPLYGCVKYFAGAFDTPSHATGDYGVTKCGSTLISIPSTGTFEASRQTSSGR